MTNDHRGQKNPNAVLTPLLVVEMRRMHKLGFGYGWIANWVGVSKSCVQKVLTGRTWNRPAAERKKTAP